MTFADRTAPPEWRAAGTDLSERRRSGVSRGPIADIVPTDDMRAVVWDEERGARIGASVSIAEIGADARLAAAYPGLTATATGLATPQIRHLATLGGNLAQRSRCWYYRAPDTTCLKKGGGDCPARTGNHLYGVAFDRGGCVAPHPSSMAAALLAYEARVDTDRRSGLILADLLGTGETADNALLPGELVTAVALPPPLPGERAAYRRATSRALAEWPLVEIVACLRVEAGTIRDVRIAAGGIASVPLRLASAEAAAEGRPADPDTIARAARAASDGANPLPMTGYKLVLLEGLVRDVLDRCLAA